MKQAVLIVSFGTTFPETRDKNIGAVLRRVRSAWPDVPVYEAWTSSMIRRSLQKRGEDVDDVPTALGRMAADGVTDFYVLPTHLLYGDEYDKMRAQLSQGAQAFFHRGCGSAPAGLRRRHPRRAPCGGRRRGNGAR